MARERDVGGIQEPVAARTYRRAESPRRPHAARVLGAGHRSAEQRPDPPLSGAGVAEEAGFPARPELTSGSVR
jgi:hypothetical protein